MDRTRRPHECTMRGAHRKEMEMVTCKHLEFHYRSWI
jgi:hypothetical protein